MTREEYRRIKSMSREHLEQYLGNLYNEGFNNGVSATSRKMAEKVDIGIRNTAGIGEKRYNELIANINAELNKKGGE